MKTKIVRVAKPSAPALNLKEFFSESYAVPPYQRELSWTESQVEEMYDDFTQFCASDEPYYYMGQTIVADNDTEPERYSIVDGQQRATALLVLLAALRNLATKFVAGHPQLSNLIDRELLPMLQLSEDGGLIPRVRPADDGKAMMIALIDDADRPGLREEWSNTCENLSSSYDVLFERLTTDITTPHELELYFRRISEGVILVRLEIHEEEAAIGVYERITIAVSSWTMQISSRTLLLLVLAAITMTLPRAIGQTHQKSFGSAVLLGRVVCSFSYGQ